MQCRNRPIIPFPRMQTPGLPARAQRGLTLIEVLIAVLVLAIGLVGLAALHINSMKHAHSSYYTSIASSIALDLEERLWVRAANVAATSSPPECLDADDIGAVLTAMGSTWTSDSENGSAGTVTIPGMTITPGMVAENSADPDDPHSDNRWVQVPITVSWTDHRVAENVESFNYTARVVCFTGNIPDEDDEE